jgi:Leucine-rich repeat (LRR) protein
MCQQKLEKRQKKYLKSIMDFTNKDNGIQCYIESLVEFEMNKIRTKKYVIHKIASLDTFYQFKSLKKLSLCDNQIDSIDSNTFAFGLSCLQELNLSRNCLVKLESKTFQMLSVLKKLRLCENAIEFIDENAFLGLTNLEELFLDDNNLDELRYVLFREG